MSFKGNKIPSSVISNSNILPQVNMKRSSFNLSEGLKTTFNAGKLVPLYWNEVYPGDSIDFKINGLIRMNTPIAPIMDNVRIKYFNFFVPNRLLWENWQRFMGERDNPTDSISYMVPKIQSEEDGFQVNTLADYLGLPIGIDTKDTFISALPFRAYNKIWNDWFRDENLQDSVIEHMGDSDTSITDYKLLGKSKPADYFTTCLPSPQKGNPVTLPLGSNVPVMTTDQPTNVNVLLNSSSSILYGDLRRSSSGFDVIVPSTTTATGDQDTNLYADLSQATAATIADLRQAFQVQRILEKDMRRGTRYIEIIKSHFGVTSPDFRLQRSEYLGGSRDNVQINPVAQTSSTTDESPQGNLGAVALAGTRNSGYKRSFTEHGIIMTLACITQDVTYQSGLPKKFSRALRFDYMFPSFAHIGEQAVLNKEIHYTGTSTDDEVFGYQERYRELRQGFSKITGQLRSQAPESLDIWHLAEDFNTTPLLNEEFIQESAPYDRIMVLPEEVNFIADYYFKIHCTRALPSRGTPGMIDHF